MTDFSWHAARSLAVLVAWAGCTVAPGSGADADGGPSSSGGAVSSASRWSSSAPAASSSAPGSSSGGGAFFRLTLRWSDLAEGYDGKTLYARLEDNPVSGWRLLASGQAVVVNRQATLDLGTVLPAGQNAGLFVSWYLDATEDALCDPFRLGDWASLAVLPTHVAADQALDLTMDAQQGPVEIACQHFSHTGPYTLTLVGTGAPGQTSYAALWDTQTADVVATRQLTATQAGRVVGVMEGRLLDGHSYELDHYLDVDGDRGCGVTETVRRYHVSTAARMDVRVDLDGNGDPGACASFAGPFSITLTVSGYTPPQPQVGTAELRGFISDVNSTVQGEIPYFGYTLNPTTQRLGDELLLRHSYAYRFYLDLDASGQCSGGDAVWRGTWSEVNADLTQRLTPADQDPAGCSNGP
ncbi:MAG: hypothetical protein HY904_12090 [Deltaproteobacteria bacterium]|nr:hypothetical protein [Deltaproteobacteria bacterium]